MEASEQHGVVFLRKVAKIDSSYPPEHVVQRQEIANERRYYYKRARRMRNNMRRAERLSKHGPEILNEVQATFVNRVNETTNEKLSTQSLVNPDTEYGDLWELLPFSVADNKEKKASLFSSLKRLLGI